MKIIKRMYPYFDQAKEFAASHWERFSERDKQVATVLAIVITSGILYFGMISPISHWHKKVKLAAQQGYEDLAFVKKNLSVAKAVEYRNTSLRGSNPLTKISATGRQAGISFSKVQPSSQGVSLWIDEVNYKSLLAWLLELKNEGGLTIKQARIERTDHKGIVKVFLRLG